MGGDAIHGTRKNGKRSRFEENTFSFRKVKIYVPMAHQRHVQQVGECTSLYQGSDEDAKTLGFEVKFAVIKVGKFPQRGKKGN